jgi:hypothetical protein
MHSRAHQPARRASCRSSSPPPRGGGGDEVGARDVAQAAVAHVARRRRVNGRLDGGLPIEDRLSAPRARVPAVLPPERGLDRHRDGGLLRKKKATPAILLSSSIADCAISSVSPLLWSLTRALWTAVIAVTILLVGLTLAASRGLYHARQLYD